MIGNVRGMGLLCGMEFVTDRKTRFAGVQEALHFFEETKNEGILIGKGGL